MLCQLLLGDYWLSLISQILPGYKDMPSIGKARLWWEKVLEKALENWLS